MTNDFRDHIRIEDDAVVVTSPMEDSDDTELIQAAYQLAHILDIDTVRLAAVEEQQP
jgi:hypothetical protein